MTSPAVRGAEEASGMSVRTLHCPVVMGQVGPRGSAVIYGVRRVRGTAGVGYRPRNPVSRGHTCPRCCGHPPGSPLPTHTCRGLRSAAGGLRPPLRPQPEPPSSRRVEGTVACAPGPPPLPARAPLCGLPCSREGVPEAQPLHEPRASESVRPPPMRCEEPPGPGAL